MVPPPSSQDPVPCPAHITPASLHCSKALRSDLPAKKAMSNSTETSVTEFILLGFPELCHVRGLLFGSFLTIYMVTILENLVIMVTIRASRRLHTPMYFFLVLARPESHGHSWTDGFHQPPRKLKEFSLAQLR